MSWTFSGCSLRKGSNSAAGLSPAFLGGRVIPGQLPATQPKAKAQFTINVTQGRIRLGNYLL